MDLRWEEVISMPGEDEIPTLLALPISSVASMPHHTTSPPP